MLLDMPAAKIVYYFFLHTCLTDGAKDVLRAWRPGVGNSASEVRSWMAPCAGVAHQSLPERGNTKRGTKKRRASWRNNTASSTEVAAVCRSSGEIGVLRSMPTPPPPKSRLVTQHLRQPRWPAFRNMNTAELNRPAGPAARGTTRDRVGWSSRPIALSPSAWRIRVGAGQLRLLAWQAARLPGVRHSGRQPCGDVHHFRPTS